METNGLNELRRCFYSGGQQVPKALLDSFRLDAVAVHTNGPLPGRTRHHQSLQLNVYILRWSGCSYAVDSSESEETSIGSGVCGGQNNDTVPSALIAAILKRSGWLGLTTGPLFRTHECNRPPLVVGGGRYRRPAGVEQLKPTPLGHLHSWKDPGAAETKGADDPHCQRRGGRAPDPGRTTPLERQDPLFVKA
ncbi:hypothetical protein EYF80_010071 [Liparis tanakae]|uniref:Uncharacterized protein n=1 Tax=Liparis tanakae TaxID=230148 RepID=A0A4Z2IPG8_9TELE|nr:hypothetical protein EYF80_010071 [Liparis tanakae]